MVKKIFRPLSEMCICQLRKTPKKNLTWPQAMRLYPKLKPCDDSDGDGLWNVFDCRPFNKKRHNDINFKFSPDGRIIVPLAVQNDKANPKTPFKDLPDFEKERISQQIRLQRWRKKMREDEAYMKQLSKMNRGDIDI